MRHLLFLLIYDPILIKGKMKPSSYGYLARIAYMHSIHEEQICKGKWNKSQYTSKSIYL